MAETDNSVTDDEGESLEGRFLIAMPGIGDPRFHRSVIFVCAHSDEGAMGLIVNRGADGLAFSDLLKQLEIEPDESVDGSGPVRFGGPVETTRGFVLHSTDYGDDAALEIEGGFRLTGTVDILRDIAQGRGPASHLIALGYTGWAAGQLEQEIQQNGWLACDAEAALVFDGNDEGKWVQALTTLGISPELLSAEGGNA